MPDIKGGNTMESNVVSIIVPVYNADKYLEDCLNSIINQTYRALEIIIIDDGSTDNSSAIIQDFARKDERIIHIKKTNSGVSSTRNIGLSNASGRYVYFCDADDMLHERIIEILVKSLKNNNISIVGYSNDIHEMVVEKRTHVLDRIELIQKIIRGNGFLWNKLFINSIIQENGIIFDDDLSIQEDELFLLEYVFYCDYAVENDSKLYFYRLNENGASRNTSLTEKKLSANIARERIYFLLMSCYENKDILELAYKNLLYGYCISTKDLIFRTKDIKLREKWLPFICYKYRTLKRQNINIKSIKMNIYRFILNAASFFYFWGDYKHMKKIGIYTLQDRNFGNRLQNYATQIILQKQGYNVVSFSNSKLSNKILREICRNDFVYYLFLTLKRKIRSVIKQDSGNQFNNFNKNISFTSDYIGKSDFKVGKGYYSIIAGSDQVWNTTFDWLSSNSFLPFRHSRKISFAASFGVDSIPYDQTVVACLNDFKALSVREEAGAKIIKDLTGRDATVIVDPTMLLTKEEWRKVSKKPKGAKEGYILTYFLSPKCDEAITKLEEIREDKEVYELLNPNDKVAGNAGPSEFLWLFEHADLILTDSFHACVFSFLFNKPFIVYDRNWNEGNMNSRLETLLSKFSLERKYANSGIENDTWEHDYTEGYKQLEIERKKAIDFLKKALED